MGYVRKPKVFKLTFVDDDSAFPGLEIQTRSLKIRELAEFGLKLSQSTRGVEGGTDEEKFAAIPALSEALDDTREMFADALISWNMEEEDGTPTPADVDGVKLLDDQEFLTLISVWLNSIGGLDAQKDDDDLGKGFGSGGTSPELSSLMEPLSPNQSN